MSRPARILIAAGGTGGHVYPAIAVANAVKRQVPDSSVAFAGTVDRIEWEAVPRAGYPIYPITAVAISRSSKAANLKVPFKLARGVSQSMRLVKEFDADVVFGAGGFVSGPVGLAAWLRGRPLVLQEQNAFAGMTNRLLGRVADQVHIAFPEAGDAFSEDRSVLSGNPVRAEMMNLDRAAARDKLGLPQDARVVLSFGGSGGSQAMNEALLEGIDDFLKATDAHLIWQTGPRYFERVQASAPTHPRVRIVEYLHDMPSAYAASDLALCRSGASTCAELLVTGTPSILIPSPNVAEDHQTHNARSLVDAGAAVLLPEAELRADWVSRTAALVNNPESLEAMGAKAMDSSISDAAAIIKLANRRAAA
jgi:UDP-N-acetylglucosamine--N-acetylmuramyl-(pentapeptide) pyrophosphoryl-undecaprenol N-acetylglucosamine transferase